MRKAWIRKGPRFLVTAFRVTDIEGSKSLSLGKEWVLKSHIFYGDIKTE